MRKTIIGLFIFLSVNLMAQSEVKFLDAFGDVPLATVADLLAQNLTLCIADDVSEVNRAEALKKLNAYLDGHTISQKKILHNGKSADKDSSYKVARIMTQNGTFRIFAYAELVDGKSVVKEIRIDKM